MQRNVRKCRPQHLDESQVLDDDPVRPEIGGKPGGSERVLYLAVVDEGIERDIDLAATDPAVAHGLLKLFGVEVFRAAASVEALEAQIYRVRSVLHGGDDRLRRSGGGKQFDHGNGILHLYSQE